MVADFLIGGFLVNEKEVYRERIIEMVNRIENPCWLRSIYIFIKTLLE